jgi:hypothetical protein
MTWLLSAIAMISLGLGLSACAPGLTPLDTMPSQFALDDTLQVELPTGYVATIARPTTFKGMMANLKFAFDHDLFLNKKFYTERNLKVLSGAINIRIKEPPGWLFANMSGFRNMATSVTITDNQEETIAYSARWGGVYDDGHARASVGVVLRATYSESSFENMERIFGKL